MSRTTRIAGLVAAALLLAGCSVAAAHPEEVMCEGVPDGRILAAQAVPSATLLPCVRAFPVGWRYGGSEVRSGLARFWLDSDRAGFHAVEVSLTERCDVEGLTDVTAISGELDVRVFLRSLSMAPFAADRYFVFEGGCVTYRYRFVDTGQAPTLAFQADRALSFLPRSRLVELGESVGLTLCGAEAPPCVGEA